ncbi:unnamed protein product, partial [Owenia fusiformis]
LTSGRESCEIFFCIYRPTLFIHVRKMTKTLDNLSIPVKGVDGKENGSKPALDPYWKEDIEFLVYKAPPLSIDGASIEEWTERTLAIIDDLEWLLKQPHNRFWSQMVFDPTLQLCIDSFLTHAPRGGNFGLLSPSNQEVQQKHHRLVFMVCLRTATHKESKDSHITPAVFGNILYENFLFDIPKIMDICALYGQSNQGLVTKMVENIFTQQPQYWEDLEAVIPTILQVFDNILTQCGIKDASSSPQKIEVPSINKNGIIGENHLQDIVHYIQDTTSTLLAYLEIHTEASVMFHREGLLLRLSSFYDAVLPVIKESVNHKDFKNKRLQIELQRLLCKARMDMTKLYHLVVAKVYIEPVLSPSDGEKLEKTIEEYLHAVTSLLSDKRFLIDYDRQYPIQDDLEIICQSHYQIDETRVEFIMDAISNVYISQNRRREGKEKRVKRKQEEQERNNQIRRRNQERKEQEELAALAEKGVPKTMPEAGATAGPTIDGIQLESLIYSVKDLLPDLGEGFIEICLEEYNYDVERVINGVLEDKLLPSLTCLDRTMPRQEKDLLTEDESESLLTGRQNIFDNDEFDIFNKKDVDMSRIHKGKKDKNSDMKNVLEDKSIIDHFKPVYDQYGHMDMKSVYDKERPNSHMYDEDYEDEYDDTYDQNTVGADDDDSADELSNRRRFVVPRALQHLYKDNDNDDEEDEENPVTHQGYNDRGRDARKDPIHFIEDPAKVRERQEQRRAVMRSNKKPPRDVKGQAKGKGQTEEVNRNRLFKDKHKATRANHNRKEGATRKQAKGMM